MDKINKYKVDKLVTEHVSDLKFGEGGQGNSIFIFAKAFPDGNKMYHNFDEAEMYTADVSGRWNYSSGKAIVLIHPSIEGYVSGIKGTNTGIRGGLNTGTFFAPSDNGETVSATTSLITARDLPSDDVWYYIVGPSIEYVSQISSGPIYDVRNFVKVEDVDYPSGQGGFVIEEIGFHYAKV